MSEEHCLDTPGYYARIHVGCRGERRRRCCNLQLLLVERQASVGRLDYYWTALTMQLAGELV